MSGSSKAKALEVNVFNGRMNAVAVAGHVFAPRTTTTIKVPGNDDGAALYEAIAKTRGLVLDGPASAKGAGQPADAQALPDTDGAKADVTADESSTTDADPAK